MSAYEQLLLNTTPTAKLKAPELAPQPKSLNQEVAAILAREGIKAPKIEVHVALIQHGTEEDAEGIRKEILECDLFAPEGVGHFPEYTELLNELSAGKITIKEAHERSLKILGKRTWIGAILSKIIGFEGFHARIVQILAKSNKVVMHVDAPRDSALANETAGSLASLAWSLFRAMWKNNISYDVAAKGIVNSVTKFAIFNRKREDLMVSTLPAAIAKAIKEHPRLHSPARTDPIKVFMYLGAAHNRVPKLLANPDVTVTSRVADNSKHTGVVGHFHKILMETRDGKSMTLDDGKVLILEAIFSTMLQGSRHALKNRFAAATKKYGGAVIPHILAEVFADKGEEVYTEYKKHAPSLLRIFFARHREHETTTYLLKLCKERSKEIDAKIQELLAK
jgi:hypothetical protein